MLKIIKCILFLSCISLVACSSASVKPSLPYQPVKLTTIWELYGFKQPESVIYDSKRDVLYVSNVNGAPLAKNGKGFISKVSLSGNLLHLKWVTGLNAPKGMSIKQGRLYVSDIDNLIEIETETGEITKKYPAPEARFLNDVTVDNNSVYVSDMNNNTIYRLKNGVCKQWLKNDGLESPNGLYAFKNQLMLACWGVTDAQTNIPGHIKTISLKNKNITLFGNGSAKGHFDGLEADYRGNYFVTDWMSGKLYQIKASGDAVLLLQLNRGCADPEYIQDKQLIIIPMMNDNKILTFKVQVFKAG